MNKFLKLNPLYVIRYMVLSAIFLLPPLTTRADSITSTLALQQVAKYSGNWTSSPTNWNGGSTTDGPLLGNGNVGVIVFNSIHNMSFLLDKNEFWSLGKETKYDMAEMYLHVPGMNGSSYSVQQNIATATVTGTFTLSGNTVKTTSWVQATDATNNLLITQLVYSGSSSNDATVSFVPGFANSFPNDHGTSGNVVYFDIAGDSTTTVGGFATCQVRCAATVIGATPSISNNQFTFTMQPGNTYTVVACIMSNYDSPSWQSLAISNISSLNASNISSDLSSHEAWWSSFYGKSYVTLPDQTAEKEYYGSLYILASASRTGHAPPGIWGPWTIAGSSGVPLWDGDFHCNYDYEVPYLGMLAANHPELLDSYATPVLNWIPNGQAAASSFGYSGVYIPSGIGPLPLGSTFSQPGGFNADPFLNQKLDAVFLAEPMIATFYRTRSTSYARTILPYLEQCAAFWTNYLVSNGTSYDDFNDAQHEHDAYPQTDGCCSLGLIHYLFQGAIDVANFLNTDASLVPTWTNYNNTLAPYPTFIHNNQTCFRATLVGRDWSTTNDCELRFIYPGDQVGLLSSPSLLSTAYNTVSQYAAQGEWTDTNATPTFYPMCARVGFPAKAILSNLDSWITSKAFPSMTIGTFGGGMENENTTTACLTEMMMQSCQGTILIFPDWPLGTSAQFGDLLAKGDFLISSSYQNSAVQYVRIISQAGQTAVIRNPWPGQTLAFYKNGSSAGTLSGTNISIPTSTGDVDYLALNGTSYSSIITAISTNNGSVGLVGSSGPYGGIAAAIPGTVQAENYDMGGQGFSYNVTSINGTDNGYRSDGVDLEATSDTGGGVDLGWSSASQWFRYTVNVATAGNYTVSFRVAAPIAVTDGFHLSNDSGTNLSGNVNVPATGGNQTWATVTASVTLPAGLQTLILNQDNGGWNINYMGIASSGTTTLLPTQNATVRSGIYASTNYNGATTLRVKNNDPDNTRHVYLTFDTTSMSTLSSAVLNLNVVGTGSTASRNITVYQQPTTSWLESTITWNNAPAAGTLIGSFAVSTTVGIWYNFDVTSYVQAQRAAGHKIVSLELIQNTADVNGLVDFASKEAGTGQPGLTCAP